MKQGIRLLCGLFVMINVCSRAMEPAIPENPFVRITNNTGYSRWVDRNHLQLAFNNPNAQPLQQLPDGSYLFDYPQEIVDLFAQMLVIHAAFSMQNAAYGFDDPRSFIVREGYRTFFMKTIATKSTDDVIIGSMIVVHAYFPEIVLQELILSIVKKIGARHIDFSSAPSIKAYERYFLIRQRFEMPPRDSIYDKFIKNRMEIPYEIDPEGTGDVAIINLGSLGVASIFGLGVLINKAMDFLEKSGARHPRYISIMLDDNPITIIDTIDSAELNTFAPHLITLSLNSNTLQQLPHDFLRDAVNLEHLFLSDTKITSFPKDFLALSSRLKVVDIFNNELSELPDGFLQNATQLEELNFANNKLTLLPHNFLSTNRELNYVDGSYNRDLVLPKGFLSKHPHVNSIKFSVCDFKNLPQNFLAETTDIELLDLSRNKLTRFPEDFLINAQRIRTINIVGNPMDDDEAYLSSLPQKIKKAMGDGESSDDSNEEEPGYEADVEMQEGEE